MVNNNKEKINVNTEFIIIISWSTRAAWVPLDHKQAQIQKKNALGIFARFTWQWAKCR